jgi:hypothetical protein
MREAALNFLTDDLFAEQNDGDVVERAFAVQFIHQVLLKTEKEITHNYFDNRLVELGGEKAAMIVEQLANERRELERLAGSLAFGRFGDLIAEAVPLTPDILALEIPGEFDVGPAGESRPRA